MGTTCIRISPLFQQVILFLKGNPKLILGFISIIVFSYILLGALPVVPIENDSMRIALGAQSKSLYGDYSYAYNYQSQVGTYKLIEFLEIINFLDQFSLFSYLTIISDLIFICCTVLFIKRISNAYILISVSALLLFQETFVSGYYPNSSLLSAAFLSSALLLVTWKNKIICIVFSGILFALAFWVRFDAILVFGAFVSLLWCPNAKFIKTVSIFIIVSTITGSLLLLISNVSVKDILDGFFEHTRNAGSIKETLNNYSTIFSLVTIYFCGLGLIYLYRARNWYLIILIPISTLPLFFAYGISVTSPKYLLYALIFFAIPISYSITLLLRERTRNAERLLFVGIILFVGQYIFTPAYELILNRSIIVYTADEARLRGAIAYTPIYWAKYRCAKLRTDLVFQAKLDDYVEQSDPSYLISHDWMANQWVLYFLQRRGYRIKETENYAAFLEDGQRIILAKGSNIVYLVRWRPESALDLPPPLQGEILEMQSILYIGPDYTTTEYAQNSFLVEEFDGSRFSDWGRFEAILFQRRP